jgi:elongation factor Ts
MSNTELIKELRALTQAGMKDCKDALEEAGWDVQKAVDIVKVKGLNIVSGREGKVASEGIVVVTSVDPSMVSMVEVNCQTDFVANSRDFKLFAAYVGTILNGKASSNEMFAAADVESVRQTVVSTTKENVVVRRWWVEEVADPRAKIFTYVHSNNKIGVMLTLLAPTADLAKDSAFLELGNDLAMQVAAMSPLAVNREKVDADVVARQKNIFETQLKELNKPQASWAKILEGKFNKWYTETCLLDQESVTTPKTSVKQVIENVGFKLGGDIEVISFTRCQVGEGIEVVKENLADEIAKMVPMDDGILR